MWNVYRKQLSSHNPFDWFIIHLNGRIEHKIIPIWYVFSTNRHASHNWDVELTNLCQFVLPAESGPQPQPSAPPTNPQQPPTPQQQQQQAQHQQELLRQELNNRFLASHNPSMSVGPPPYLRQETHMHQHMHQHQHTHQHSFLPPSAAAPPGLVTSPAAPHVVRDAERLRQQAIRVRAMFHVVRSICSKLEVQYKLCANVCELILLLLWADGF